MARHVPSQPPSSRYSWIIFDADNTLFDFDRAERGALERTLGRFGMICDAEARAQFTAISARLWRAFESGAITSARLRVARFEELLAGRVPAVDPQLVSEAYLRELGGEAHLLPRAEEVVRRLAVSHQLLLATNGIADIQRRRFGAATIGDCFHDVVISDEIGIAKPHSGFFDEAFRRMGDPAREQVLLVGDSLTSDIAGGAAYGIDTCWFCPRDPPATPARISTAAATPSRVATSPAASSGTTGDEPAPCMATDESRRRVRQRRNRVPPIASAICGSCSRSSRCRDRERRSVKYPPDHRPRRAPTGSEAGRTYRRRRALSRSGLLLTEAFGGACKRRGSRSDDHVSRTGAGPQRGEECCSGFVRQGPFGRS